MTHGIDTGFLVAVEVAEHPAHQSARRILKELRAAGHLFGLAPQVLAEFIHVVTDPKRFSQPLDMETALSRADLWWNSPEVTPLPSAGSAVRHFFDWMRLHRLGRKRILDTLLAASFREACIHSILTTNERDFTVLGGFQCIVP
jgi:predicted nucleic acid-binding protein